jgi:hypothetical protein
LDGNSGGSIPEPASITIVFVAMLAAGCVLSHRGRPDKAL